MLYAANSIIVTNLSLTRCCQEVLRLQYNLWAAADCCELLVAPEAERIKLLGVGNAHPRVPVDALQLTECYEFALKKPMVSLQVSKFAYATLLADVGVVEHALDYVQTVIESIRSMEKRQRQSYTKAFVAQIQELEKRLKLCTKVP